MNDTQRVSLMLEWTTRIPGRPGQRGEFAMVARRTGSAPRVSISISAKGKYAELCTLVMQRSGERVEIWPNGPRKLDEFLAVINGDAVPYDPEDPRSLSRVVYDYARVVVWDGEGGVTSGSATGSGLFLGMSSGGPTDGAHAIVSEAEVTSDEVSS